MFNIMKKEQAITDNMPLIPYSFATEIRKKYAAFMEKYVYSADTIVTRDTYWNTEHLINDQCLNAIFDTKDKMTKALLKEYSKNMLLDLCFNDSFIDYTIHESDKYKICYDEQIIANCKSIMNKFKPILLDELNLTYSQHEINGCYNFVIDSIKLMCYKYNGKGSAFCKYWDKCGFVELVMELATDKI